MALRASLACGSAAGYGRRRPDFRDEQDELWNKIRANPDDGILLKPCAEQPSSFQAEAERKETLLGRPVPICTHAPAFKDQVCLIQQFLAQTLLGLSVFRRGAHFAERVVRGDEERRRNTMRVEQAGKPDGWLTNLQDFVGVVNARNIVGRAIGGDQGFRDRRWLHDVYLLVQDVALLPLRCRLAATSAFANHLARIGRLVWAPAQLLMSFLSSKPSGRKQSVSEWQPTKPRGEVS